MESFAAPSDAADQTEASLDQASFTEMFHSSPAATPAASAVERFRDPATGQFLPRNLNDTAGLCATEPRPAVEQLTDPAFKVSESVDPQPEENMPAAAGEFIRVKKKGGVAQRSAARGV